MLLPDLPVKAILDAAGYSSSNTFSKAFKRKYGMSATGFRESEKRRNMMRDA
jgi:AraC-like DNA-binding protein